MGQNATGTFTADAVTQTITADPQGFGNSHISTYQVRRLPEQGTLVLIQ